MKLILTTPERELINETDVVKVNIPTAGCEITILPSHIPLISSVGRGGMTVSIKNKEDEEYFVSGGVLQVFDDNINILANLAEKAQEIDEAEIEESIRRARVSAEESVTSVGLAEIQAKLANDLARLKLASKYKSRRRTGIKS